MAFAQLTYRESLRDIECCLRAMRGKLYHTGIRGKISRSTLADANEARNWRIYSDFAQILIHEARRLYVDDDFGLELKEPFMRWIRQQLIYACQSFHGLVFAKQRQR
jgi:hypothetical protein